MATPINRTAFARAGLLGNPSDGYHGKTISFIVRNFAAVVTLRPADTLKILPAADDIDEYSSINQLLARVQSAGYYGGQRLIKAAIVCFAERFADSLPGHQNFEVSYTTNIPRSVGLAGSSAIVVATLKALTDFFQVALPPDQLASLSLHVERHHLGIPAGLQDRVIQSYEGLVYMDFAVERMTLVNGLAIGSYESLDPELLNDIYIAYSDVVGEPTEVAHQDLRQRFEAGDPTITQAMRQFAELAERGKSALLDRDSELLGQLINQNFDLRKKICHIHPRHQQMVDVARRSGASAKFCGSGGAIVGTFQNDGQYRQLVEAMAAIDCRVIRPQILPPA